VTWRRLVGNAAKIAAGDASPEVPRGPSRGHRVFAMRATLSAAVLAILLFRFDFTSILASIERERLSFFIATIALYLAGQVMSAFRWQLLARLLEIAGPFREYLTYYFIGIFTNLFVPGLVGGDAARALYLGRRHDRIGEAVASVIADRAAGMLALLWFAAACVLLISGPPLPRIVMRTVLAIGAASLIALPLASLISLRAGKMRGRLGRMVAPAIPYLREPHRLALAIALSVLLQASLALCQFILARGLGLRTPFGAFILIVPIANVVTSLPITINGLGLRETTYIVLFGMAGVATHEAIALGVLWFAATTIGGLSGIFVFVTTPLPPKVLAETASKETQGSRS
jgi:uncharacterized membrane protein YbhN (UPF0104 family)